MNWRYLCCFALGLSTYGAVINAVQHDWYSVVIHVAAIAGAGLSFYVFARDGK